MSVLFIYLLPLGCRSDNPLEWKPSWDWERELSDELMIEAYLKAKWRCGVETATTAGWEESEKGPLRPEAWRTTESQKRVLGPLLFETRRHGWNNKDLACDFARNLAKQGIATWSDVTEWGTGEVLTWPQMKRVYGLRDNTTEHSEYKRLAEQLMRPEWAQLRREWKWAVTEQRAHGQKTGWRTPDRVLKVKAARKAPTCYLLEYGGGTEEEGHGWEYLCEWEGEQRDSWVWHDKMASVEYARPLANTWGGELRLAQCVRRKAASFREWLEYRSRPGRTGPEVAHVVKALETCDGEGSAPSWSDVLDRFVEYSREVNGVCTSGPNMTEHTFEEGRTKTNIRVEGRAGQDALPRREETGGRQRHAPGVERGRGQSSEKDGGDTGPRNECDMGGGDTRA